MQARALGTSLAMAVARGCAPVEIKCNGTINSERLSTGCLDNAGAKYTVNYISHALHPVPCALVLQLPALPTCCNRSRLHACHGPWT